MKFVSAVILFALTSDVHAVKTHGQRILRNENGSNGDNGTGKSGKNGKGKSAKSKGKDQVEEKVTGFVPNTRFQSFTPLNMFAIGVDTSNEFTFVSDPEAYVYSTETLFGDGEEDESYCNAIGCMREYYNFATKGMMTGPNAWSVRLWSSDSSSTHILCPRPNMIPTIPLVICRDPGANFGTEMGTSNVNVEGPTIDGFSASISTTSFCSGIEYVITCIGTVADIQAIQDSVPSDSPGFDGRPYTDAAMMMTVSNTATFWSPDPAVTSFEIVDVDKDGDANACNTFGCVGAYDIAAYLRGPDPNFAVVASDSIDSRFRFMCPVAGQQVSLTPKCDGVVVSGVTFSSIYLSYGEATSFTCSGVRTLEIRCT